MDTIKKMHLTVFFEKAIKGLTIAQHHSIYGRSSSDALPERM